MLKTFYIIVGLLAEGLMNNKRSGVVAILISSLMGFTMFLGPFLLGQFVRSVQQNTLSFPLFIYLAASFSANTFFGFIWRYRYEVLSAQIQLNCVESFFYKISAQKHLWFTDNSTSFLASMIRRLGTGLFDLSFEIMWHYVPFTVYALCFSVYLFSLSAALGFYVLLFIALTCLLMRATYKKRLEILKEITKRQAKFDRSFQDFLINAETLTTCAATSFARKILEEKKTRALDSEVAIGHYNGTQWLALDTGVMLALLVPLGFLSFQDAQENLTAIVTIAASIPFIHQLIGYYMNLLRKIAALQVAVETVTTHITDPETTGYLTPTEWRRISFHDVLFSYKEKKRAHADQIITHFEILPRDRIAIIGESGAGKSTFLRLICNQIQPLSGRIMVDETDYAHISDDFFHHHVAVVSQNTELFDTSLRHNILLGRNISDTLLDGILKGTCLDSLVARLPDGLDTIVGEKGIRFSAGQRQRVNIARALVSDKSIYIFDEVTANIDTQMSLKIWTYIIERCPSATLIVVSHAQEFKNFATKIIQFDDGTLSVISHNNNTD